MQSPGEVSIERRTAEPSPELESGWLDPVTGDVLMQVMTELASMMSLLGRAPAGRRISEIQAHARALLHQVARLVTAQEINPWIRLRMTPEEPPIAPSAYPVRVGVFPLSANPIHWGHLLSGLSAMARARLDKIVYVIAHDASLSTDLYPEELRRGAAAEAISLFQPLFTFVPASAGKTVSGPASFFRLLSLNSQQTIEAFYISAYESGSSASIMEIMDALWRRASGNAQGHNENQHPVSLIRVDGIRGEKPALQNPRVVMVPQPLPGISTHAVRAALMSALHREELSALPACAFLHLRMLSALD